VNGGGSSDRLHEDLVNGVRYWHEVDTDRCDMVCLYFFTTYGQEIIYPHPRDTDAISKHSHARTRHVSDVTDQASDVI